MRLTRIEDRKFSVSIKIIINKKIKHYADKVRYRGVSLRARGVSVFLFSFWVCETGIEIILPIERTTKEPNLTKE